MSLIIVLGKNIIGFFIFNYYKYTRQFAALVKVNVFFLNKNSIESFGSFLAKIKVFDAL